VAIALAGRAGSRLAAGLCVPASRQVLLRLVMAAPDPAAASGQVRAFAAMITGLTGENLTQWIDPPAPPACPCSASESCSPRSDDRCRDFH